MESLKIETERDLALARNHVKQVCQQLKLSLTSTTKFITAVSELGRNMLIYANGGELQVITGLHLQKPSITCIFIDKGPGIENIDLAMEDGYSSRNSLGKGLPGAKRICNFFELKSELGKGSQITISQW